MRGLFRFLIWGGLIIGLLVGALRFVAIRWVRIQADDVVLSASLVPSLYGGDLILLQRVMKPTLGDLVLCPEPEYPERYVIGRVAGEALAGSGSNGSDRRRIRLPDWRKDPARAQSDLWRTMTPSAAFPFPSRTGVIRPTMSVPA